MLLKPLELFLPKSEISGPLSPMIHYQNSSCLPLAAGLVFQRVPRFPSTLPVRGKKLPESYVRPSLEAPEEVEIIGGPPKKRGEDLGPAAEVHDIETSSSPSKGRKKLAQVEEGEGWWDFQSYACSARERGFFTARCKFSERLIEPLHSRRLAQL